MLLEAENVPELLEVVRDTGMPFQHRCGKGWLPLDVLAVVGARCGALGDSNGGAASSAAAFAVGKSDAAYAVDIPNSIVTSMTVQNNGGAQVEVGVDKTDAGPREETLANTIAGEGARETAFVFRRGGDKTESRKGHVPGGRPGDSVEDVEIDLKFTTGQQKALGADFVEEDGGICARNVRPDTPPPACSSCAASSVSEIMWEKWRPLLHIVDCPGRAGAELPLPSGSNGSKSAPFGASGYSVSPSRTCSRRTCVWRRPRRCPTPRPAARGRSPGRQARRAASHPAAQSNSDTNSSDKGALT